MKSISSLFIWGFVLSVFSASVGADQVYKDWNLAELESDPVLQVPVCHAFTTIANSEVPVGLSLTFPKNLAKAPIAFIKIDPSLDVTQVLIKTSSRDVEPAVALSVNADPVLKSYWYIPMDMDRLIKKIAAANYLEILVQVQGAETPIRISLSGSSKILQETKRCAGGDLFSETFFDSLNDKDAAAYPVDGEITLERGFEFFQTAYIFHVGGEEAKKTLEALRHENRGILREEASAQRDYNSAKGKLDDAQKALDENDTETAQYRATIVEKQNLLAKLGPKKTAAEQDLATKKQTYEPLRQEAKAYEAKIDGAESEISSAQRRIRSLKNSISTARSEIESLESEASGLESQIRSLESQRSRLQSDLSDAEREYRNYDVIFEAQRILDRDFSYQNAKRDLPRTETELLRARQVERQSAADLQRAEQNFRACSMDVNRNCSAEQAAVSAAQSRLGQAQGQVRGLERKAQQLQSEIQWAETRARDEAHRNKQQLSGRVSSVSSELQGVERQIENSRSRIRSIFDFEIPSRNQTIRSAQNEIPRQERALASAKRDLEAAQAEFNEFKARTDFDRIKAEYVQAEATLKEINGQIAESTATIEQAERRIVRLERARPPLVQNVERRKVTSDQKLAKLQEVQSRMVEFKAKEAELVKNLETMLAQFDQARGLYKTVILEILN